MTAIHEQIISLIDNLSTSIYTKKVHEIFRLFSLFELTSGIEYLLSQGVGTVDIPRRHRMLVRSCRGVSAMRQWTMSMGRVQALARAGAGSFTGNRQSRRRLRV